MAQALQSTINRLASNNGHGCKIIETSSGLFTLATNGAPVFAISLVNLTF